MRNASNIVVMYPSKQDLNTRDTNKLYSARLRTINTLYVHIPFCTGICSYCDFARTATTPSDGRIAKYLHLLEQEASLLNSLYGTRIPVASIYIGGGTPTLLDEPALQTLFELIHAHFTIASGEEFTLEGSPETISIRKILLAKQYGVNRISIGAESFNNDVLISMRRRADNTGIFSAINNVRKAGIDHIDIDLIRGYPGYSVEAVLGDLKGIEIANTPSVTSYQYSIKPKAIDRKHLKTPMFDQEQQIFTHILFIAGMKRLGYQHRSPLVDWFTKGPRWTYRQQLQKWQDMANLIGIGLGSYGYIDGIQYINFDNFHDYENCVINHRLPTEKANLLTTDEIMHRRVIFGLKGNISRAEFRHTYGIDITEAHFQHTLKRLTEAGGIDITEASIRLSDAGALFADWLQMSFYSDYYHQREASRATTRDHTQ
ncbi:MAG: coproporphyrinogen III oxidase family protein [Gammaproteobacteria bacterium]|nr:coproporphyrinogen III oxidase family protein [Gammaproteobacteria bacterium]